MRVIGIWIFMRPHPEAHRMSVPYLSFTRYRLGSPRIDADPSIEVYHPTQVGSRLQGSPSDAR